MLNLLLLSKKFLYAESRSASLFFLTFLVFATYAISFRAPPYFGGDAQHYWMLGQSFFRNGQFSYMNYEATFRGYFLPLVLGIIQNVGDITGANSFKIFFLTNAFFSSVFTAFVVPNLVKRAFGVVPTTLQNIFFVVLFLAFWRGYLLYPLSDTWALFLTTTGCLFAIMAIESNVGFAIVTAALAGVCIGVAANLRPVYIIVAPGLLAAIAMTPQGSLKRRLSLAGIVIAAMALPLAPQSALNMRQIGTANPLAHSGNLYTLQMFLGIGAQRVECAYYLDTAGIGLLEAANIHPVTITSDQEVRFAVDVSQKSLVQYLKIVLIHPLDFTILYIRHIFSGFILLRSDIYECYPTHPNLLTMFLSLFSIIAAMIVAAINLPLVLKGRYRAFLIVPILLILPVIPASIEGRFFLPMHMLAYAILSFVAARRETISLITSRWPSTLSVCILLLLLGLVQMSALLASTYLYLGAEPTFVRLRANPVLIDTRS